MILHRQTERVRIYVFQDSECWKTFNYPDIDEFLCDRKTWYLTDALGPQPAKVETVTILVSSPTEKHYSQFLDRSHVAPLHYLPIWSLDELKLVAPSYNRDGDVIKKRFDVIGGLARYVLEKDEDLEAIINIEIKKLLSKNLMRLPTDERSGGKYISHRLVHFEVEPPCYTKYKLVMASEYVREKFLEALDNQQDQEFKYYFSLFQSIPMMASSIGLAFQQYANQKLSAGGQFLVRSLDDESESILDISPRTLQKFTDLSECTSSTIYYTPAKKNFPCIDSLILEIGYFQMTVSLRHKILWKPMKEIKDSTKMDVFYYVVPHTHYKEFKKQPFSEVTKKKEKISVPPLIDQMFNVQISENVDETNKENAAQLINVNNEEGSERDLVQQYVISIPVEKEMAAWVNKAESKMRPVQQDGEEGEEGEEEEKGEEEQKE